MRARGGVVAQRLGAETVVDFFRTSVEVVGDGRFVAVGVRGGDELAERVVGASEGLRFAFGDGALFEERPGFRAVCVAHGRHRHARGGFDGRREGSPRGVVGDCRGAGARADRFGGRFRLIPDIVDNCRRWQVWQARGFGLCGGLGLAWEVGPFGVVCAGRNRRFGFGGVIDGLGGSGAAVARCPLVDAVVAGVHDVQSAARARSRGPWGR